MSSLTDSPLSVHDILAEEVVGTVHLDGGGLDGQLVPTAYLAQVLFTVEGLVVVSVGGGCGGTNSCLCSRSSGVRS